MFVKAYLETAGQILRTYKGEEPFSSFLKKYFSLHKKFGSRDRKQIAHLCYCFFRLGKSLSAIPVTQKLTLALFLCDQTKSPLLEKLSLELNEQAGHSLPEKIQLAKLNYGFKEEDLFPFREHLSGLIDEAKFYRSSLTQPLVYIRIRPGNEEIVKKKLAEAGVLFEAITDRCVAVEQNIKLDEVVELNKEAVIQDRSSQEVLSSLLRQADKTQIKTAWDCCAASGGKSILLKDYFPGVRLTVSDVRDSILNNLKIRFKNGGIKDYRSMVHDLSTERFPLNDKFDLIICDVPCSGSGTWSRTPEQLYFFKEQKILEYAALQKKIVGHAVKSLKKGSWFLYITCSVFKEENEEAVSFITDTASLTLIDSGYLKGYNHKADTLFTALFRL